MRCSSTSCRRDILAVSFASLGWIGVFAVSAFDTDYLIFKDAEFQTAVAALKQAGQSVEEVML